MTKFDDPLRQRYFDLFGTDIYAPRSPLDDGVPPDSVRGKALALMDAMDRAIKVSPPNNYGSHWPVETTFPAYCGTCKWQWPCPEYKRAMNRWYESQR